MYIFSQYITSKYMVGRIDLGPIWHEITRY